MVPAFAVGCGLELAPHPASVSAITRMAKVPSQNLRMCPPGKTPKFLRGLISFVSTRGVEESFWPELRERRNYRAIDWRLLSRRLGDLMTWRLGDLGDGATRTYGAAATAKRERIVGAFDLAGWMAGRKVPSDAKHTIQNQQMAQSSANHPVTQPPSHRVTTKSLASGPFSTARRTSLLTRAGAGQKICFP